MEVDGEEFAERHHGIGRTEYLFSRNKKAREIDRALTSLVHADCLQRRESRDCNGRPTEVWVPRASLQSSPFGWRGHRGTAAPSAVAGQNTGQCDITHGGVGSRLPVARAARVGGRHREGSPPRPEDGEPARPRAIQLERVSSRRDSSAVGRPGTGQLSGVAVVRVNASTCSRAFSGSLTQVR